MSEQIDNTINIIILGDVGVGKTHLIKKFVNNIEIKEEELMPTIGFDTLIKKFSYKKKLYYIKFWDTAGQEKYRALSKNLYKFADGAILVYSIESKSSLKSLPFWFKGLEDEGKEKISKMMIGNKKDLIENRQVSEEEGKMMAKLQGSFFFETSAKFGDNVENAFKNVLEDLIEKNYLNSLKKDNKNFKRMYTNKLKPKENAKKSCC